MAIHTGSSILQYFYHDVILAALLSRGCGFPDYCMHFTSIRKGICFSVVQTKLLIKFIYNATYRAVAQASGKQILQPGSFVLQAPIYNPEKLICIGMNYVDHCTEQNIPVPEEPVIFSKFNSAITEPNGPVLLSDETQVTIPGTSLLQ